MSALFVNPISPNVDLAQTFLEFFAAHLPPELEYTSYPDRWEPVRYEDFDQLVADMRAYRDDLEDMLPAAAPDALRGLEETIGQYDVWLAEAQENQWLISSAGIANYHRLAPLQTLPLESLFFTFDANNALYDLYDIQLRYAEGNLTLDAFLSELNSRMRMMFLEGQ